MDEINALLDEVFSALSRFAVCGDDVDVMHGVREKLRLVYRLLNTPPEGKSESEG